jgi:hypothetical protein
MANPAFSDDDVLIQMGASGAPRIGAGSEAQVYALPGNRVARIMRAGARLADAETRAGLLREIAGSAATLSFRTPAVRSVSLIGDRVVTVEERLPGEPVSELLGRLTGTERRQLLADYLNTALRIRQAKVARPYFGPLIGDRALRVGSWSEFARARLAQNLRRCPAEFREAVYREMGSMWVEPTTSALVHLDYFPPNVLAEGDGVTAVLDFGPSAIIGNPDMEAWSAVAYLDAEISPQATDADRRLAMEWLAERGMVGGYAKARRWLAASWTHATDDPSLMAWCRRVLLETP